MKRYAVILLFIFSSASLQLTAQEELWRVGTALTLQHRQFDVGLFQPLRYGAKPDMEVQAYVLPFYRFPNVTIKKFWTLTAKKWFLASKHGVAYPSLFLDDISKAEFGGILPEKTVVPFILAFTNEALASKYLIPRTTCTSPDLLLTLTLGFKFAFKSAESEIPTIDYPFAYWRAALYSGHHIWYLGADLEGHLTSYLNYSVDLSFYAIDIGVEDFALEHKALLVFPVGKRTTLAGGYIATFGTFPYGIDYKILPMFDISVKFNLPKKRKDDRKLFDPNMRRSHRNFYQERMDKLEKAQKEQRRIDERREREEEKNREREEENKK